MNNHELEELLREAGPRKATAQFKEKLMRDLAAVDPVVKPPLYLRWSACVAAAFAVVLLGVFIGRNSREPAVELADDPMETPDIKGLIERQKQSFEPTSSRTMLVSYKEEPVTADGQAYDRHSYELVDCMEWVNPENGNRVRITRPRREQVILCSNTY